MTDILTPPRTISTLLAQGQLAEAIAAVSAEVKAKPTSTRERVLLAELLALDGAIERADTHLKLASDQAPADVIALSQLRWLLRGAEARRAWHDSGATPEFLGEPTARQQAALRLTLGVRAEDVAEIQAALGALEAETLPLGRFDGGAPVPFRDVCDLSQHGFEALTLDGRYLWIDPAQVETMAFQPIRRPRDRLWRPAETLLRDGRSATFFIVAQYYDIEASPSQKLGQESDWVELPGGAVRGRGQRMLLAGDDATGLLDIGGIAVAEAA